MDTIAVARRVKRQFGDESGAQLTDADIIDWINDGQREAVMQNEGLLEDQATIDVVAGTDRYAIPATVFSLNTIHYRRDTSSPYYLLTYLNVNDFNKHIDGWDDSEIRGEPAAWTEIEQEIVLFPNPDTSVTAGLKYVFSRYPVDVTAVSGGSGITLDLPEYYHQFVVNYVLMKAYEMDEDAEQSQAKAGVVQADLNYNEARRNLSGRDTYPVIRELPEDLL